MIWNGMVTFGLRHPVLMRGIVGTIATVIFGYILIGTISGQLIENQRDACERGNETRLAEFREKESLIAAIQRKQGALEVHGSKEIAIALGEEATAYKVKQQALEEIAERSGHPNSHGSVTINCIAEYPKPLTIPGTSG